MSLPAAPTRVTRLVVNNYMMLKAVDIAFPQRGVLHITGRNGQGKSSALNAAFVAFGSAKSKPEVAIRLGQERGEIRVETDTVIVTRRFYKHSKTGEEQTQLTLETPDGARYPSPQRLVDEFFRPIAFDPLEFMSLDDDGQYKALRALLKLDVDLDQLDALNRADFEKRRDKNRDADTERGKAKGIQFPEGLPARPIDEDAIAAELRAATEGKVLFERQCAARQRLVEQIAGNRAAAAQLEAAIDDALQQIRDRAKEQIALEQMRQADAEQEIARLEALLADERQAVEQSRQRAAQIGERVEIDCTVEASNRREQAMALRGDAHRLDEQLEREGAIPEPASTDAILARLEEARRVNASLKERQRYEETIALAETYEREAEALTEAMEARNRQRREAMERAQMPVPGLALEDGRVLFNRVPLRQISSGEQLRVSVAVAMATQPTLRFMTVRQGVYLDDDNMEVLASLAQQNDIVVFCESIDSAGKVGVVIDDGEVVQVVDEEEAARTRRSPRERPRPPSAETGSLL